MRHIIRDVSGHTEMTISLLGSENIWQWELGRCSKVNMLPVIHCSVSDSDIWIIVGKVASPLSSGSLRTSSIGAHPGKDIGLTIVKSYAYSLFTTPRLVQVSPATAGNT